MSRRIWSMGFTGLAAACGLALWLQRPVELSQRPPERRASGEGVAAWLVLRPATP